ncbi:MAG TPA: patatin-like phospholipase family protein [Marmoricola sp.]|nr:patatin-like phospholipase family protein [Marmoricola sp.]
MTTAFVLSGGGTLGAVQVGMLLALAERGTIPDLIVGSSVGALNAAFLAADPSVAGVRGLERVWRGLRRRDVFPLPLRPLPGVAALAAVAGRRSSLVDAGPLRRLVRRHLAFDRLEDAPVPVHVVATDVLTGHEVVLSEGPAVDAVLASAALPGVLPPVAVEDHLLVDGGVVDNSPISVAVELGAERVVVLPTGYACALTAPPRSALGTALHAVTLAVQRRLLLDVAALQDEVDLQVVPPLCPLAVSPADFSRSGELVERALASTRDWLDAPRVADQASQLALHRHAGQH